MTHSALCLAPPFYLAAQLPAALLPTHGISLPQPHAQHPPPRGPPTPPPRGPPTPLPRGQPRPRKVLACPPSSASPLVSARPGVSLRPCRHRSVHSSACRAKCACIRVVSPDWRSCFVGNRLANLLLSLHQHCAPTTCFTFVDLPLWPPQVLSW